MIIPSTNLKVMQMHAALMRIKIHREMLEKIDWEVFQAYFKDVSSKL